MPGRPSRMLFARSASVPPKIHGSSIRLAARPPARLSPWHAAHRSFASLAAAPSPAPYETDGCCGSALAVQPTRSAARAVRPSRRFPASFADTPLLDTQERVVARPARQRADPHPAHRLEPPSLRGPREDERRSRLDRRQQRRPRSRSRAPARRCRSSPPSTPSATLPKPAPRAPGPGRRGPGRIHGAPVSAVRRGRSRRCSPAAPTRSVRAHRRRRRRRGGRTGR